VGRPPDWVSATGPVSLLLGLSGWACWRRTVKPDMRGLVTAGRVVRLERASLSTEGERGQPGLVVHRSRVDPVPRAGFRIQPAGKDNLLMILFVGRLPQIVGGMLRRGGAGRSMTCPMMGLSVAVEAAGSRAAVGRRGSDRVSDP
jgi:hypothetical protein